MESAIDEIAPPQRPWMGLMNKMTDRGASHEDVESKFEEKKDGFLQWLTTNKDDLTGEEMEVVKKWKAHLVKETPWRFIAMDHLAYIAKQAERRMVKEAVR